MAVSQAATTAGYLTEALHRHSGRGHLRDLPYQGVLYFVTGVMLFEVTVVLLAGKRGEGKAMLVPNHGIRDQVQAPAAFDPPSAKIPVLAPRYGP